MTRKFLLPLDGTKQAERVLPYAVAIATQIESELLLLRVVEHSDEQSSAEAYLQQLKMALEGQEIAGNPLPYAVRRFVARVPRVGNRADTETPFKVETLVTEGNPAAKVIEVARQQEVNAIFMSLQKRAGISRLVGNGVAARVLHDSHLPMLLVRPHVEDKASLSELFNLVPPNLFRKPVVVALDGSDLSEKVLRLVKTVSESNSVPLALMEVIPTQEELIRTSNMLPIGYYPQGLNMDEIEQDVRKYLSVVEKEHLANAPTHLLSEHVARGNAATEIVSYARKMGAGAIAMATHARTGFKHAMLGSVTEKVVEESGIPVLVVNGFHYIPA